MVVFNTEGDFQVMSRRALPRFKYQALRQALRLAGVKRLALLFAVSIILTLWLKDGSVTAEMLFQSPQSPAPSPVQQAPAQQQPAQAPTEPPPAEASPTEPAQPAAQPTEPAPSDPAATNQPVAEPAEDTQAPANQSTPAPADSDSSTPIPPLAEQETLDLPPETESEEAPSTPIEGDESFVEEDTGSRNFILDRAELIDSVVVTGAYVWLCCGVMLFLLVPIFMLVLYVRGRSKIINEEGY
jgi:hypothetical protein